MISIILTILKIIGFVLLALLFLVLLLLFVTLFVPLRYSARLTRTEEESSGEVRLTWLLHLVSVRIRFDMKDNQPDMQLRVLGISLADVKRFFQQRKQSKKQNKKQNRNQNRNQKSRQNKKQKDKQNSKQKRKAEKPARSVKESQKDTQKDVQKDVQKGDQKDAQKSAQKSGAGADTAQGSDKHSSGARDTEVGADLVRAKMNGKQKKPSSGSEPNTDRRQGSGRRWFQIRQKLLTFWNRVKQIPAKAKQLFRQLRQLLKKPTELLNKLENLRQIAEKNEFSALCSELSDTLKNLLKHFRVRRGSGYLQFGTGDASATGEITGLIYLFLPVSCGDIQIQPQFTEQVLRLDIQIQGHVRLIHLVRAGWKVFRSKKLRGLIRDLRA
ncbi:MAG: DUF2953 domain-containing protein [Lachnospiraceae bacterium]|nr:DUF2953 domain-containing protein [Lachnospiraceae bacterium]